VPTQALPTALSFYGIAKETVKGTWVTPVDYLPLTKLDPVDKTTWLVDDGMRGSMVKEYNKIPGPVWSETKCTGPVFPDTIGYPLMGFLGDVTATGSGPYVYAGSLKNSVDGQPTSQSITDFNVVETRGYAGAQWMDLSFKWDGAKLLTWDGTFDALQSAVETKPTSSYTTVTAQPGWLCATTLNSISTLTLIDATFTMKRTGGPINTSDGTQAPYQIFAGDLSVTGKLTVVADANTQLANYLAGTKIPMDFKWSQGAGATATTVQLHSTLCNLDEVSTQRGKAWVEYAITFTALPNSTDAGASGGVSPIKATITNAKPSNVYV
jgi:Phage tail tube protein